jgi:putative tryptophan/tyrosine transport system substrate-binding protein
MRDLFTLTHRAEVTSLAARYCLPAIYPFVEYTEVGGLLSDGNDIIDSYRRAASYVDRILKGAKPSELPVATHARFCCTHESAFGPWRTWQSRSVVLQNSR